MNIAIIIKVPEDVFLDILSSWLELKSVNLLDSAFCNSKVRNYVLDQYQSPVLSVKGLNVVNNHILQYIYSRGLKLRELNGDTAYFHKIFMFSHKIDVSKVTTICDMFCNNDKMGKHWAELLSSCPRLTHLGVSKGIWLHETTITHIAHQLKVLMIGGQALSEEKNAVIVSRCCNLTKIALKSNETNAMKIIRNNKQLEFIELTHNNNEDWFSHNSIDCIQSQCRNIKELLLHDCGNDITLSDFTSIYNQNKQTMTRIMVFHHNYHRSCFQCINNFLEIRNSPAPVKTLVDCFKSFNKVTHYELKGISQLNDSALFAISENTNTHTLMLTGSGTMYTVKALSAFIENCPNLNLLSLSEAHHINKQELVSLFEIKNNLKKVYLRCHNTVISILESTFKHRPDESQGGLIKEKSQKLNAYDCDNVEYTAIRKYLRDNKDCYVVSF